MLLPLEPCDFDKYLEFVYTLALDPCKSGYPTYTDGIKTKEDFIKASKKAFSSENNKILVFIHQEKVEGWIQYYTIPEYKYISTSTFNIRNCYDEALKEFLVYTENRYKGYELYMGFPSDNTAAVEYLTMQGFSCIENDNNNSFFFDNYTILPQNSSIHKITKDNFEDFRKIHDQYDENMYWNSDRIFCQLDRWNIYGYYKENKLIASVYFIDNFTMLEIFGFDFDNNIFDKDIYRDLLIVTLNEGKRFGAKYMTYFCDKECQPIVSELGFKYVGEYMCFYKKIS